MDSAPERTDLASTAVAEEQYPYAGAPEGVEAAEEHPSGIHLPPTSIWPITLAFGITVAASGLVFNLLVSIAGGLLFVWALYGWAQELLHSEH